MMPNKMMKIETEISLAVKSSTQFFFSYKSYKVTQSNAKGTILITIVPCHFQMVGTNNINNLNVFKYVGDVARWYITKYYKYVNIKY